MKSKPTTRFRHAVLALAAILLTSAPLRASEADAKLEADLEGRKLADQQVRIFGIRVGPIGIKETVRLDANLSGGEEYVFVCGGCKDAHDVDLMILESGTERMLGVDTDESKRAVIRLRVEQPTKAILVIKMARSTSDGAHYALVAGTFPNNNAPITPVAVAAPSTPAAPGAAATPIAAPMATPSAPGTTAYMGPKLDLNTIIKAPSGADTTLREVMGTSKALYIRVWATWCPPCKALVPTLAYRDRLFGQAGIKVMTLNNEFGSGGMTGGDPLKARLTMTQLRSTLPVYCETPQGPIVRALGINTVPRSLIITADGTVLYNEHPINEGIKPVLEKLGVAGFDILGGL